MISITPEAAAHIRESAEKGGTQGLPLRVAAMKQPDGSLHYALGFDDVPREGDQHFSSEGIDIVVAPTSFDLLNGTVIDYVELEPGKFEVIFINPNDPAQQNPPQP
ncbi:MAG TPA: iron-sulfur cluster assembly accessory protein [Gammaproteobacteria bacterium]|nr:iron-sulfur cluster assembly accessory protein [Gammaproteobacteria bacterium]